MNVMTEIMRREERMLVPWLIDMGHWGAASTNKQSLLCSPEGEVILATSDTELIHDASV
jgi:hypothetical protein